LAVILEDVAAEQPEIVACGSIAGRYQCKRPGEFKVA